MALVNEYELSIYLNEIAEILEYFDQAYDSFKYSKEVLNIFNYSPNIQLIRPLCNCIKANFEFMPEDKI